MLVLYALQHAKPADKTFLKKCLGNPKLAAADFEECKQIIKRSGALTHAQKEAAKQLDLALDSLKNTDGLWNREGTDFLKGIARALQNRVS